MSEEPEYLEQQERDKAREDLRNMLAAHAMQALVAQHSRDENSVLLLDRDMATIAENAVSMADVMMRELYPD
jgi:hypothetical protein